MTRLRMKDTPEDVDATLKAERRQRKKRRREERSTASTNPSIDPRDLGYDESSQPPFASTSRSRRQQLEERAEEEAFNDKLHSAMEEDQGVGFYQDRLYRDELPNRWKNGTAASFSYGGAAGVALGMNRSNGGLDGMDEEEYEEHIRAGMWRRKNKDEVARQEEIARQAQVKAAKDRIEDDKRRATEREKIRKLEEKVKRRGEREDLDARERYEFLWKRMTSIPSSSATAPVPAVAADDDEQQGPMPAAPHPYPLRFTDFPWPLYPPVPFPPLSWPATSDITASSISSFLFSHLSPTATTAAAKKAILRTAVLAYHPDRFDRLLLRIPEGKEDVLERVRELGLRVSQVLNDLIKASGENAK